MTTPTPDGAACLACPLAAALAPLLRAAPAPLPLPGLVADEDELSMGRLCEVLGIPARLSDSFRKRVATWQKANDRGWSEVANRRCNEPLYKYAVGAVRHLAVALLADHQGAPVEDGPGPTTF